MIKTIISDFSYVLLFPKKNEYNGSLNGLHGELMHLLGYNVLDYFYLNLELIECYKSLAATKNIYLFTEGNMHTIPELQKELDTVFKKLVSAKDVGFSKNDPQVYIQLANVLDVTPGEALFIDDKQENIDAAITAGFQTLHFVSTEKTIKFLRENY